MKDGIGLPVSINGKPMKARVSTFNPAPKPSAKPVANQKARAVKRKVERKVKAAPSAKLPVGEFHKVGKDLVYDIPVSDNCFEQAKIYMARFPKWKGAKLERHEGSVKLSGKVTTQIKNWISQFMYGYETHRGNPQPVK